MKASGSVVTFGETLIRLSPPDHLRLRQTQTLDLFYGGAEANVAVSLANWDVPVQYVTRLPKNELGASCVQALRQYGVGVDFIEFGGDRLGLYFLEVGSGGRPSKVIYDRAGSSFATLAADSLRWSEAFAGASRFHWSGISPAVSAAAAEATSRAVGLARQTGLTISCDLNYRHSLWNWGSPPATVMPTLIEQCDVLAANSAQVMLGLPDLPVGRTAAEATEACFELSRVFPSLKQIAMTCREPKPGVGQGYTAILWHSGRAYTSRSFTLAQQVEQVGAGDAFMAGLIYGLMAFPHDAQQVIEFAAASAVLKYSVRGDVSLSSREEIEQLLKPHAGFDIIR